MTFRLLVYFWDFQTTNDYLLLINLLQQAEGN